MPSYLEQQRQLFDSVEKGFKSGAEPFPVPKFVADYEHDERVCLTSIAFVPPHIEEQILTNIIPPLRTADDRQYYYVLGSYHYTVQNIQTIYEPTVLSDTDFEKVKRVFADIVPKYGPFRLSINGLFELPTSLSLRVYSDENFQHLTEALQNKLKEEGVADNKFYASENIRLGNITISRYSMPPTEAFFKEVEKLKDVKMGSFDLATISLITTNLVCHPDKTSVLAEFPLDSSSP